jgi:hypothetical protein
VRLPDARHGLEGVDVFEKELLLVSSTSTSWVQRQGPAPVVCAASAFNAVGLDAHQTWAFWRAQVTPFTESPFICPNGERATMALCRVLSPRLSGDARVIELASRALGELSPLLSRLPERLRCAFGLALPERIAGEPQRARRVLDAVSAPLAGRWPGLAPRVQAWTRRLRPAAGRGPLGAGGPHSGRRAPRRRGLRLRRR